VVGARTTVPKSPAATAASRAAITRG
jgi:hypothetical protein